MKVGIIGLGLIGGSMAIDLKRRGFADEVFGVEAEPVNASAAEKIGLVDKVVDLDECLEKSDLVVLAVPVGTAVRILPKVFDRFKEMSGEEIYTEISPSVVEIHAESSAETQRME